MATRMTGVLSKEWMRQRARGSIRRLRDESKRVKAVAKTLGNCNYTPQTARVLANVLVQLGKQPLKTRQEVLSLFAKVANGEFPK